MLVANQHLQEQTSHARRSIGRGRRLRRIAFLALAVGLAMTAAVALHPSDASAFTWSGHGSYGSVGVPVAKMGWANLAGESEQIVVPQRMIKESPAYATQDQNVCITHYTWEWDGGFDYANNHWTQKDATKDCGWIYANQTYIYDRGYKSPYNPIWGTSLGYNVKVTWKLRSGVTVADMTINYQVGNGFDKDLRCGTEGSCFHDSVVNTIAIYSGSPFGR